MHQLKHSLGLLQYSEAPLKRESKMAAYGRKKRKLKEEIKLF